MWAGERSEPFLASSIPDLGLDDLALNGDSPGLKLNPNGGLGVNAELVLSKPGQQLTLPHRRVSDHHHLEHIIYFLRPILSVTLRRLNPTHFLIHFHPESDSCRYVYDALALLIERKCVLETLKLGLRRF